jgi:TolA-binding protein
MRLWLIIQDNVGLDSTDEALKLYSNAELLMFQNKYTNALQQLEEISIVFPNHTLADEILFLKGLIKEKMGYYKEAEAIYSTLIKDFSTDILSDNALINLAKLYEFKLQDTAKAKQMYEFLIMNYTGSIYINEARLRFRYLRGDMKNEKIDAYWD